MLPNEDFGWPNERLGSNFRTTFQMKVALVLFLPEIVALDVIFALSTFFTTLRSRFIRGLKVRLFLFATLHDATIFCNKFAGIIKIFVTTLQDDYKR